MNVTTIIPAYNEAEYLGRTIEDLLVCQTEGVTTEILVVDDGSTDGTLEIARQFPVRIYTHTDDKGAPKNFGKLSALRTGVSKASGDVVLEMDADMYGVPSSEVRKILDPLYDSEVDMVVADYWQRDKYADRIRCGHQFSGVRGIRTSALSFFSEDDPNFHKIAPFLCRTGKYGVAVEKLLDKILPANRTRYVNTELESRERGKGATPLWDICVVVGETDRMLGRLEELSYDPTVCTTVGKILGVRDDLTARSYLAEPTNRSVLAYFSDQALQLQLPNVVEVTGMYLESRVA